MFCVTALAQTSGPESVALGSGFGCGLSSSGEVKCWGRCSDSQCGAAADSPLAEEARTHAVPVFVSGVRQISAGFSFACALKDDGTVWCWGSNRYHQLGQATEDDAPSTPVQVQGLEGVEEIAVGGFFACARIGERVSCWGNNRYGELSTAPTLERRATPERVAGRASSIHAGTYHACMVDTRGRIRCWGASAHGQAGTRRRVRESPRPTTVRGATRPASISLGGEQGCLRLSDGALRCWGHNLYGADNGAGAYYSTPQPIPGLSHADAVAVQGENHCAVHEGRLYCWGVNRLHHLHVPTDEMGQVVITPSAMPGIDDALDIAMGWDTQCVKRRSTGWSCWGRNRNGAVGVGSRDQMVSRPMPLSW